jgi:hypothetical protein
VTFFLRSQLRVLVWSLLVVASVLLLALFLNTRSSASAPSNTDLASQAPTRPTSPTVLVVGDSLDLSAFSPFLSMSVLRTDGGSIPLPVQFEGGVLSTSNWPDGRYQLLFSLPDGSTDSLDVLLLPAAVETPA